MADNANNANDDTKPSKLMSIVKFWATMKRWAEPERAGGNPDLLQMVLIVLFLLAFLAWYTNIYLTFKIGKRLKDAIDNADLMRDYEPVYDRAVIMKVANNATFGLKTYLLHLIILTIAALFAGFVSIAMLRISMANTDLLGKGSTFKLWMFTFTAMILITWIVALVMFLMANRAVRKGMSKVKQVSDGITANITTVVDYLNVLKELPTGNVKINPNVLNPSNYYVDNVGFSPGDEKKAAELLFTTALYWWMMKNVPADVELRQQAKDLFDPTTVLFKKLSSRFGSNGGYINLMTAKDKFMGEFTDQDLDFLKENLRCEDPVECQNLKTFADFFENNRDAIMEHYNSMKVEMGDLASASEDFEGSFNAGKRLYEAMTWLNGWIPALTIIFIGIAIIEAKSECKMWKMFGGTVIALGMLPMILRRYVF